MSLYQRVAELPVTIDAIELDRQEAATSSGFDRSTTTITLRGAGRTGRGEDVTYETDEHVVLEDRPPAFPLTGDFTVRSAADRLDDIDLFPWTEPDRPVFRRYRRWGFESAVLDLALRQAGQTLGDRLDRPYEPVRFVVSTRLGEPPTADRVRAWLDIEPSLAFKLDVTNDWTPDLIAELAATDRVRILDLKGQYEGTEVDQSPDPPLYRRLVEAFPDALFEDPPVTPATEPILEPAADRVSWDAPITDPADLEDRPWPPRWINIKPSRFGSIQRLFDCLERCRAAGISLYGGGQFELGVGRGQLQVLASLFYPDGPNDVAPRGYNEPTPRSGLPTSPLVPGSPTGFRW